MNSVQLKSIYLRFYASYGLDIQNALYRAVSGAHQKIFFVAFGPFKNFLSTSEPKNALKFL